MSNDDDMWPDGWDEQAPGAAVAAPARPAQAPDPAQAAAAAITDGMNGMASQATRVEAIRAAAEVMAQVQAAQAVPRKMKRAVDGIRQACAIEEFAEKAFYRYPRGKDPRTGKTNYVTGVSVYLARELLRLFGNAQSGIAELSRDDGQGRSEMNAWAWDVEYNVRQSTTFLVPHARDKTVNGQHVREAFVDMRDIYENNANQGARRLRQMILAILPPWYVGMASDLCRATIAKQGATDSEGKPVPLEVRLTDAVEGFTTRWGIRLEAVEQKLGVPFDKWVEQDLATLRVLYRSIARGETTVDEEFPPAAPTDAELTAQAAARAPEAAGDAPPPGVDAATGEVTGAQPAAGPATEPAAEPAPDPAAGAQPAATPMPQPPAAEPEPPADPLASKSTASKLSHRFQQIGWTGDDYRERRRVLSCYLAAAGTSTRPRMVASVAEMTEAEAGRAIERFDALLTEAGGDTSALSGKLQNVYAERERQRAAHEQEQAGAAT